MTVLNVISLLGGMALFLFGMTMMGNGLEKLSGGRLERILEKMTSNVFKGVLLGCLVTAVIQSSSATTVMVVGFVNAGIMKLAQAIGVIMGANIGTTVTSLILGLNDIDNAGFLQYLKPVVLAPVVSLVGIVLFMFIRKGRNHDIGMILLGFGTLFFGMLQMEHAVEPLKTMDSFANLMLLFSNPFFGVLVGAVMTAIIQSSSASVGILQALSSTGAIRFSAAAPIILGQNIGTCVTALLSSIGASKNAKRAALIHLYFNIIGTIVFLIGIYTIQHFIGFSFWDDIVDRSMIASFHLSFNIGCTALLLPFNKLLYWLAVKTIKDDPNEIEEEFQVLDERFLATPSIALDRSREVAVQMGNVAMKNLKTSFKLFQNFDEKMFERLKERETSIDKMDVKLSHYMLNLKDRELSELENKRHLELFHVIGDVERIGDYAVNLAEEAQRCNKKNISFSEKAVFELSLMTDALTTIFQDTLDGLQYVDIGRCKDVEPLEEVIDNLTDILKSKHIKRLKNGECDAETGAMFLEILINLERIADHCSNIAMQIIQTYAIDDKKEEFDQHEYLRRLHSGEAEEYNNAYKMYQEKYIYPVKAPKSEERR